MASIGRGELRFDKVQVQCFPKKAKKEVEVEQFGRGEAKASTLPPTTREAPPPTANCGRRRLPSSLEVTKTEKH